MGIPRHKRFPDRKIRADYLGTPDILLSSLVPNTKGRAGLSEGPLFLRQMGLIKKVAPLHAGLTCRNSPQPREGKTIFLAI